LGEEGMEIEKGIIMAAYPKWAISKGGEHAYIL